MQLNTCIRGAIFREKEINFYIYIFRMFKQNNKCLKCVVFYLYSRLTAFQIATAV